MSYAAKSSTNDAALTNAISRGLHNFKHVDGLILNAGTLDPLGRIDDSKVPLSEWKAHFDMNFFSLIPAIRVSLPGLRKTKGKIVFVSSGAAVGGTAGWGPYNAGKAALNSLCRSDTNAINTSLVI